MEAMVIDCLLKWINKIRMWPCLKNGHLETLQEDWGEKVNSYRDVHLSKYRACFFPFSTSILKQIFDCHVKNFKWIIYLYPQLFQRVNLFRHVLTSLRGFLPFPVRPSVFPGDWGLEVRGHGGWSNVSVDIYHRVRRGHPGTVPSASLSAPYRPHPACSCRDPSYLSPHEGW